MSDALDLDRFLLAQEGVYEDALAELKGGRKRTHWMWFLFPQIQGLGQSETAKNYAIRSREEAESYLAHEVLGSRLKESASAVLGSGATSATELLGTPDDLKLKSSMTLFERVDPDPHSVFSEVLRKYYEGQPCPQTVSFLSA
jgi:uncharacterized protein (DUF1810 family)